MSARSAQLHSGPAPMTIRTMHNTTGNNNSSDSDSSDNDSDGDNDGDSRRSATHILQANTNRNMCIAQSNRQLGTLLGNQARENNLARIRLQQRHVQKNTTLAEQHAIVSAEAVPTFAPDSRLAVTNRISQLRADIEDLTLQQLYNEKKRLKRKVAKSGTVCRVSAFSAGFSASEYTMQGNFMPDVYAAYINTAINEYDEHQHSEFRKGQAAYIEQYTAYIRAHNRGRN